MFTAEEQDGVREQLLARAEADVAIVGAALTGSHAVGENDRWSDTDLVFAVRGELTAAVERWTTWLYEELGAQHHWDLSTAPSFIRMFLLPGWIELDLTFAPEAEFGPRGRQWQTVFGTAQALEPFASSDRNVLAGLIWHHALHAWICLQRGRWWQAEHWISAIRDHVITLACQRLGHPDSYAKGAHLLPAALTGRLEGTLVRFLTAAELRRALEAVITVAAGELEHADPVLMSRLGPMLEELMYTGDARRSTVRLVR